MVDNKIKKPGPVFTGITKAAYYEAKADYYWTSLLTSAPTWAANKFARRYLPRKPAKDSKTFCPCAASS